MSDYWLFVYNVIFVLTYSKGINPCPSISGNDCFRFVNESMDWDSAEGECQTFNGHLISIHDDLDNANIINYFIENASNDTPNFWIGGHGSALSSWSWFDKTTFNYNNWTAGENHNASSSFCIGADSHGWHRFDCTLEKPFFCSVNTDTTPMAPVKLIGCNSIENGYLNPWNESDCILYFKKKEKWKAAESACEDLNGTLLSIHEEDFNTLLIKIAGELEYADNYWIGGIYAGSNWTWSDNTTRDYDNLASYSSPPTVGRCISIVGKHGAWLALPCDEKKPYFCTITVEIVPTTSTVTTPEFYTTTIFDYSTTSNITSTSKLTTLIAEETTLGFTNNSTPSSLFRTSKLFTTITTPFITSTTTTPQIPSKDKSSSSTKWYIIGGVAFLALIIIILFGIFMIKRKKEKTFFEHQTKLFIAKLELSPLEMQLSQDERLKFQINSKNIDIDFNFVLGRGSNATVYKALIKGESKLHILQGTFKQAAFTNCQAALKLPTTFDVDAVETFIRELDALIKVGSHPHIISLLGWSMYNETPALLSEIAETTLLSYVKDLRNQELFPFRDIISILWQISQALEHISTFSMVHRDVACRNILLLNNNHLAKLADFGLCCHCDESLTYKATLQKRLPIKWLSLEALLDRIFSEKSDVWSFGVLCWEVYSYGAIPYPAMTNIEMLEFLQAKSRLEKPPIAPENVYEIVLRCWKEDAGERPTFLQISKALRSILEADTAGYGYLTLDLEAF